MARIKHNETTLQTAATFAVTSQAIQRARHAEFIVSKYNVRKTGGDDVVELAALIQSAGRVLQNVVAFRQINNGNRTGILEIVAGGRRWRAVKQLIDDGKLPTDFELDYLEITEDVAIEMSLSENAGREAMYPADEFEAMQTLIEHGKTIADVAAAFGIEPIVVKRHLKLANISPEILQLYREDQADLAQLEALAITDDHQRQQQAWTACPEWNRSPSALMKLLTTDKLSVRDKVAQYVGVTAYTKAGGVVVRDLFSNDGEDGFIDNVPLLESLALAKLTKQEKKLLKEGFAWIDINLRADYQQINSYGKPRTSKPEPTTEEQTVIDQLQKEQDKFDSDVEADQGNDEFNEELDIRGENLETRWNEIDQSLTVINPEDAACVGALVTIDRQGTCQVIRNLVRPEDMKRISKEAKAEQGVVVAEKTMHSEKLTRELTAQRTIALQAEIMNRPDVALVALTTKLAKSALYDYTYGDSIVKISVNPASLHGSAPEIEHSRAFQVVEERRESFKRCLPAEPDRLFEFLLQQEQQRVVELLAFCVATMVDAVQSRESPSDFAMLANAVNLNMCNWWTPTEASYFKHISRASIIEVISEAVSAEASLPLHQMKKSVAAAEAERMIAASTWLPSLLQAAQI
jgi:ParB family chromosome partitioning protein